MAKKKKKSKSLINSDNEDLQEMAQAEKERAEKAASSARAKQAAALALAQAQAQAEADRAAAVAAASASPGTFGTFGSTIAFQVNDPYNESGSRSIAVPSKMQRQSRGRWSSYNLIGRKPIKSFEGPDSAQVTVSITLDSDQGVNPRIMMDRIVQAIEAGTVDYLVIGGKIVGSRCYIESMSETWERFFQGGRLTRATGEITFAEYA